MVQTPNPPPCTPSGISICLPVDFGGPPASPQLLEPPLTSPRPPSHGAVALSSTLLAMRAANLDEASFLLSLLLMALRVCPRSRTWGTGLGVMSGIVTGPLMKPPDPAPPNPVPHGAFATACRRGS